MPYVPISHHTARRLHTLLFCGGVLRKEEKLVCLLAMDYLHLLRWDLLVTLFYILQLPHGQLFLVC